MRKLMPRGIEGVSWDQNIGWGESARLQCYSLVPQSSHQPFQGFCYMGNPSIPVRGSHVMNRRHCGPDRPVFKGVHVPWLGWTAISPLLSISLLKLDEGSQPELPLPCTEPGPPTDFKGSRWAGQLPAKLIFKNLSICSYKVLSEITKPQVFHRV